MFLRFSSIWASVTLNTSDGGVFATFCFPSLLQTDPAIPYKLPVPDVIPLACSHIASVLNTDWSTHNDAIFASGHVDGTSKAMIWNIEDVGPAFKGWGHEGQAGFTKTSESIPSHASMLQLECKRLGLFFVPHYLRH
jgi:hypothetical protein